MTLNLFVLGFWSNYSQYPCKNHWNCWRGRYSPFAIEIHLFVKTASHDGHGRACTLPNRIPPRRGRPFQWTVHTSSELFQSCLWLLKIFLHQYHLIYFLMSGSSYLWLRVIGAWLSTISLMFYPFLLIRLKLNWWTLNRVTKNWRNWRTPCRIRNQLALWSIAAVP